MTRDQLSEDQVVRYSRNILLPRVDVAGQRKLLDSGVFVVGADFIAERLNLYWGTSETASTVAARLAIGLPPP